MIDDFITTNKALAKNATILNGIIPAGVEE